jgi:hypothetical protein
MRRERSFPGRREGNTVSTQNSLLYGPPADQRRSRARKQGNPCGRGETSSAQLMASRYSKTARFTHTTSRRRLLLFAFLTRDFGRSQLVSRPAPNLQASAGSQHNFLTRSMVDDDQLPSFQCHVVHARETFGNTSIKNQKMRLNLRLCR